MNVPNCDVHGTPMRQSANNPQQFYCTQKIGVGPKDYCTRRYGLHGYYTKGQTPPSVPQTHLPAGYTQPAAAYQPPPQPLPQVPMPAPVVTPPPIAADGLAELRLRAATSAVEAAVQRYAPHTGNNEYVIDLAYRLYVEILAPAMNGAPMPPPVSSSSPPVDDEGLPF